MYSLENLIWDNAKIQQFFCVMGSKQVWTEDGYVTQIRMWLPAE